MRLAILQHHLLGRGERVQSHRYCGFWGLCAALQSGFGLAFIASAFLPSLCCQLHAFTSLDTFRCQLSHLLLHEPPIISLGVSGALSFPLPVTRNPRGPGLMAQLLHVQENGELRVVWGTAASESALGVAGCSSTFGLGLGFAVLWAELPAFPQGELLQPLQGLQGFGARNQGPKTQEPKAPGTEDAGPEDPGTEDADARAIARTAKVGEDIYEVAKAKGIEITANYIPSLFALKPRPVETFVRLG